MTVPTPAHNLSPNERRILAAVTRGEPGQMMLDWVAFHRLIAFGYLEENAEGRFQATPEGRRALRPTPDDA